MKINLFKSLRSLYHCVTFEGTVESGYRGKFGQRKIVLYNQVSSIKRVEGNQCLGFDWAGGVQVGQF